MSVIREWGSPFEKINDEVRKLRQQWLDAPEGKEKEQLEMKLFDLADKRKFCIVTNNAEPKCVRHILRVSDDAEQHLDELKAEYYADYNKLSCDEFHFIVGWHKVNEYIESWK